MTSTFFIMPGLISLKARAFLFILAIGMPSAFGVGSLGRLFVSIWFGLASAFGTLKTSLILAVPGLLCPRTWLAKDAGSRGCAAKFAVWHFVWKEIAIRFLPVGGAPVQLEPRQSAQLAARQGECPITVVPLKAAVDQDAQPAVVVEVRRWEACRHTARRCEGAPPLFRQNMP